MESKSRSSRHTGQEVTKRLPAGKKRSLYLNKQCAVIATLRIFATKWKPCILCYLSEKPFRYNDLFRAIPNISRKMLSRHLLELQDDGLIERVVFDSKLQRVEYSLSRKGSTLLPIMRQIQDWGLLNLRDVVSIEKMMEEHIAA
jgi:DNA-binding HxlR family transcriptional regulator